MTAFPSRIRADSVPVRTVLGLTSAVPTITSMLPLSALLSVLLLPIRGPRWNKWVRVVFWFAVAGALAMLTTGLFSPVGPYTTQVLGFAVFAVCLAGFSRTAFDVPAAVQILAAASLGTIAYFALVGWDGSRDITILWKYGIAFPVASLVIYLLCVRGGQLTPVVALIALAGASLFLEYRSFSGVCVGAVIAWIFHSRSGSSKWWVLRAAMMGVLVIAASSILLALIEQGVFGEDLRSKTAWQLEGGGPALLSGRVEPPLSAAAIVQSPIVGWGHPNALDSATFGLAAQYATSLGMSDLATYQRMWVREDGRVSLHSLLFESWVTGGVFAALLPLGLLVLFVAALFRARGRFYPLIALVCLQGVWDVLFSPWADNRAALLAISALIAALTFAEHTPSTDAVRYRSWLTRATLGERSPSRSSQRVRLP